MDKNILFQLEFFLYTILGLKAALRLSSISIVSIFSLYTNCKTKTKSLRIFKNNLVDF